MSIFRGVNVVSIAVPDLPAARVFYENVLELGAPIFDLPEAGWIEFETGAPGGNLSITTEGYEESTSQRITVVLNTDDCRATYEKLKGRGVKCDEPVEFTGYVVFCTFYDPFGNKLQMCSPAPSPEE